jgi:cell division protein ZapE
MFRKFQLLPASVGTATKVDSLVDRYNHLVKQRHFQHDAAQLKVIDNLQALLQKVILQDKCQKKALWANRVSGTSVVSSKHLYIYGGVGHGKSMLMDLFFMSCPIKRKRRVHFHAFMQEVHAFIHNRKKNDKNDLITALAKQIRNSALLLCFDEFHVTDIADAMIMERLFRSLFDLGVVVVMTSNRHPQDLYRGGLLREQFIPFVELLLSRADVVALNGDIDYRAIKQDHVQQHYCFPLNEQAENFARQTFFQCTNTNTLNSGHIEIFGRQVFLTAVANNTLLTSFGELCQQPLGAADYLLIAERFDTVIMTSIPKLSPEFCDEARRFEILVDALYEYKVRFFCTAEAHPREIYKSGEGAFEFKRTVSRLLEMQSVDYGR